MPHESVTPTEKMDHVSLIPLLHLTYHATVTGVFARVRCRQEFGNRADHPFEAVYTFPLPDEASVMRCVMRIGEKTVAASLKRRDEARQDYRDAVAGGHHASLLEQDRPNIFTINVGGIEPGETIQVEIDYVQRVPWQAQGGRFRIPLVVAPQFIPGPPIGRQAAGWSPDTDAVPDASRITPPVARDGVPYHADISIAFSPGFPCEMRSPSHPSLIEERTVPAEDTVALQTGDLLTDRDFTLVYTSLSPTSEVAVHLGAFHTDHFLLASIIPPGTRPVEASDVVLVLDCSGSMEGPKISGLKVVAKKVVQQLREQGVGHRVAIVPFDSVVDETYDLNEIDDATAHFIDRLEAGGGTHLGLALHAAEVMLSRETERPRTILMVTDGDTEHGKDWQGHGIRLIGMGIDTAVNDTRITHLSRNNGGVAEFVYPGEDYGAVAQRLTGFLSGPVLQDVAIETDGEGVGVTDVFQGRPATIAIRFAEAPTRVRITGKGPEGDRSWEIAPEMSQSCGFAAQIWARDFIREHPTERDRQIEVSLTYGVLCPHTSFVAVSRKEVAGQPPETVTVPVHLPDTWNYHAVTDGQRVQLRSLSRIHVPRGADRWQDVDCSMAMTGDALEMAVASMMGANSVLPLEQSDERSVAGSAGPYRGTPPVPKRLPERFTLDATEPVDRLVGIVCAVARNRWDEAQQSFTAVKRDLTCERVASMSEEQRTIAYYFALRLAKHGLHLEPDVMRALSVAPSPHTLAWSWYNLSLKEQGRPYDPWVPEGYEAAGYLQGKFCKSGQPAEGAWSSVV